MIAQSNTANDYLSGRGTEKSYAEAVKWLRYSANKGDPQSQFNLGMAYAKGHGVTIDYIEAHKWHIIAEAAGDQMAHIVKKGAEKEMTKEQVAKAKKLAREWMEKHEK